MFIFSIIILFTTSGETVAKRFTCVGCGQSSGSIGTFLYKGSLYVTFTRVYRNPRILWHDVFVIMIILINIIIIITIIITINVVVVVVIIVVTMLLLSISMLFLNI